METANELQASVSSAALEEWVALEPEIEQLFRDSANVAYGALQPCHQLGSQLLTGGWWTVFA
jgi:hypothetical protein